jgi:glycosyltransferase involved in cell wall biosynthesis
MISLLAEGWRFVPHSYAFVNQWQCLELMKRPDVLLYFRDASLGQKKWPKLRGVFGAADEASIGNLPDLPAGHQADVAFRMTVPVSFRKTDAARLYVLGTADFGWLPNVMIEDRRSLAEAHAGSDAILVSPSAWSKWGLIRAGAQEDRVIVLPHGVDAGIFRPPTVEERRAQRLRHRWTDRFVFLNVSAHALSKGTDLLLKAFSRVAVRFPEAMLALKGSDEVYHSREWVQRWMRERLTQEEREAIKNRVWYSGKVVSFRDLAGMFGAADAYVTPYRSESFNLPALEAIACGLPLICTSGGPTDDYTTDAFARRIPARLVPGNRPNEIIREPALDELTDAMCAVLEDSSWRESARLHGPQHVRERFTWSHVIDQLLHQIRLGDSATRS